MPTSDQWDEMTRQAVQEVNTRLGLGVMPPATGLPVSTNPGGIAAPPSSYSSPTGGAMGGLPQGYHGGGEVAPRADQHGYGMVPGQGEGDKIPIMAEPGEIVIPKNVVNYKGKEFFLNLIEKTQQNMGLRASQGQPKNGKYTRGGEVEREQVASDYTPLTTPGPMKVEDLAVPPKMGMPYEQFNREMLHADDPPRQPLQPQPPTFQQSLTRGLTQGIYGNGGASKDPVGIPASFVKVGEGEWGTAWAEPGTAAVGDEPTGVAAREAMNTNRRAPTSYDGTPKTISSASGEQLQQILEQGYPKVALKSSSFLHPGRESAVTRAFNQMPGTGVQGKEFAKSPEQFTQGRDLYDDANMEHGRRQVQGMQSQIVALGQKQAAEDLGLYQNLTGDKATDAVIFAAMSPIIQAEARGAHITDETKEKVVLTALGMVQRNQGKAGPQSKFVTADDRPITTMKGVNYVTDPESGELVEYKGAVFSGATSPATNFIKGRYLELEQENPGWTPAQLKMQATKDWDKTQQGNKLEIVDRRTEGLERIGDKRNAIYVWLQEMRNAGKVVPVINSDWSVSFIRSDQAGGMLPASPFTDHQIVAATYFKEIAVTSSGVKKLLNDPSVQRIFTDRAVAGKIAILMSDSEHPRSAVETWFRKGIGKSLTQPQRNYLVWLASMMESANSLRSIQGMGQASDTLRRSIMRMLPSGETPNLETAREQMRVFDTELTALGGRVLNVPVPGGSQTPPGPGGTVGMTPGSKSKPGGHGKIVSQKPAKDGGTLYMYQDGFIEKR